MRRLGCKLVCSATVIAATLAAATPSQAGFFDFLFRPQPGAQNFSGSFAPPLVIRKRHKMRALHDPRPALQVTEKPALEVALCCKNGEDPQSSLLRDPTLRPGDAVMMANGVRIFRGGGRIDRHRMSDFSSLSAAKNLSRSQKLQLKAIDANNARLASAEPVVELTRTADNRER